MSFFVRACCVALKEFPAVNAEIDGDDIVYKNFVHMGIAVGGPAGLVVPVIRDADAMGFARDRAGHCRFRQARARRRAEAGGTDRRHVQHHQRRRLRLADVHADPEPAAVGDPGHAQDPGAADRGCAEGRDPADDVSRAVVRPPHRRWQGGGVVPGAGEGRDRGSAPAAAGVCRERHGRMHERPSTSSSSAPAPAAMSAPSAPPSSA